MSLEEKVLHSKESTSFIEKRKEEFLKKIENDNKHCVWHQEQTTSITEQQIENLLQKDKNSPLYGLFVGVKDLFCIKGSTTSAGSAMLKDFVAPYNSTVWQTLEDKGCVLSCKTSMDEFAMGSYTDTSFYGKTLHPLFDEKTAGGSSGGSAVALCQDFADFTIGSDTGGSVRLPASYCSLIGYKPSYGAFSRYGMISYASSLDQAGFFTKDLKDIKYLLDSDLAQKDYFDPTQRGLEQKPITDKKEFVVGFFPHLFEDPGLSNYTKELYQKTVSQLQSQGIFFKEIKATLMDYAAQIYYVIACSEASSNLAKYQGIYFGTSQEYLKIKAENFFQSTAVYRSSLFGKEVQRRILLGSSILSSENFKEVYEKSWNLRKLLSYQLTQALQTCDTLMLPCAPDIAPDFADIEKMTPAQIYSADFLTVSFSLAGLPVFSCPVSSEKLSVSMQFVGKKYEDYQLLHDVSKILEIKG